MGLMNKFNKGSKFEFKTPEHFEYWNLNNLVQKYGTDFVFTVKALYINHKSQFGDQPTVVTEDELVNLPQHLNDTVVALIDDDEVVEAVNNNHVGFKIVPYELKKKYQRNGNKTAYSVEWLDI